VTARPRVLVAFPLPAVGLDRLRARFEVEAPDASRLLERAPGAAAIIAGPDVPVSAELLDAAGPSLRVVSNFGVGYDNLDLEAIRRRGLRATNTPDVLSTATAELAVALMLATARRVTEADAQVRRARSINVADHELLGRSLAGATVGIVGFGRIGLRVADLLGGFDVRLLYTSPGPRPGWERERRELPELLGESDFVSVHVPLRADTRHLIDRPALMAMKRGAILVNTSRGGVVDTAALIDALRSGHLGAAGLDVYEGEPDVPAELCELPNTVLLPHIGSATAETRDAMAVLCADNVIAVIEGREPPAAVV
jgi:glyoxylate reductase